MNSNAVTVILGLAVVTAVVVLLRSAQARGGSGEATFSFADLFTATVKLQPQNMAKADEAVRAAAQSRGQVAALQSQRNEREPSTRLARVLWVDDQPDNNLYETVALEQLGRFITKATTTDSALFYLSQLDFTLVITDLERGGHRDAGLDFIQKAKRAGLTLPIVVYTSDATRVRERLLVAGAKAVVDSPAELIHEVQDGVASASVTAQAM